MGLSARTGAMSMEDTYPLLCFITQTGSLYALDMPDVSGHCGPETLCLRQAAEALKTFRDALS